MSIRPARSAPGDRGRPDRRAQARRSGLRWRRALGAGCHPASWGRTLTPEQGWGRGGARSRLDVPEVCAHPVGVRSNLQRDHLAHGRAAATTTASLVSVERKLLVLYSYLCSYTGEVRTPPHQPLQVPVRREFLPRFSARSHIGRTYIASTRPHARYVRDCVYALVVTMAKPMKPCTATQLELRASACSKLDPRSTRYRRARRSSSASCIRRCVRCRASAARALRSAACLRQ